MEYLVQCLHDVDDWYGCGDWLQKLRQTDGAMWSLSELTQAIVIICHVHSLAVFLAGCKLYSADAVLDLFKHRSCSELTADRLSLADGLSTHPSNALVNLLNIIFCFT